MEKNIEIKDLPLKAEALKVEQIIKVYGGCPAPDFTSSGPPSV